MTISSKPHIVLVDTWRVVNAKGGTEKVFCEMANALVQRGYNITAICHDENQGKPGFELRKEVHFINAYQKPGFFDRDLMRSVRSFQFNREKSREKRHFLSCYWKAQNIKNALKSWNDVDIIISFQPVTTFILKTILKMEHPVISMFHMSPEVFSSRKSYKYRKAALDQSCCIQVLIPEYLNSIKKLHPKTPAVVIPNVAPMYDEVSNLNNKTIITVARLTPQKRPELLVKAFMLIKDKFPDWQCEWYGETNVHQECTLRTMNLIKENGLEERILFKGPCNDIPQRLKNSAIFAFPTAYEGLSIALLEAFSMGLPAVGCNDCPSVSSMITDNVNGFTTPPTPEDFALALSKLMENKDLRMQFGQQAKLTSKEYSADVVWQKWDDLLHQYLSN